uniref:Uncharacterized protein n=1 Tax=Tanacetum cinerariifolium TaxID=118510 RepID=A0A6L2N774_TANCI|nr:hypothetical protein [Tanacetum cinerariifolium]
MGESLSLDHVFNFPEDEPEPYLAYDFFAPGPLPGYSGNPNNNNRWLKAYAYVLGELEAMANEPMAVPAIEEVAEPVAEAEEEQVVAPVVDMEEEQMAALVMDMGEDLEVNDEWLMPPVTPPLVPAVQPSSVYEVRGPFTAAAEGPSFPHSALGLPIPPSVIEDLSTLLGNLEYEHRQLMVHAADRWEQVEQGQQTATQRDETIAELTQQVQVLQAAVQ